jgi:hypothetical protein
MTMSTATKPEQQSTAVALRDPLGIGNLPVEVQQQLELRKLSNQVAGELAKINWGAKLDLSTRRAVADWGRQFRVDVTTEIHILGGNVYLNAAFFIRKLSELIDSGIVEYAWADHIEDDPRLAKLGPDGEGEATRRLRERIKHGVPDKAASAVIFRIKLRTMEREVTGAKWCGNGTRKNDPVGDDKPMETAESRAARRAMRLLATHVPRHVAEEIESIEESVEGLSERVIEAKQRIAVQEASVRPPQALAAVDPADPYGVQSVGPDDTKAGRDARAREAAGTRDPYDESGEPSGAGVSSVGDEVSRQSPAGSAAMVAPLPIDERAPLDEPKPATGPGAFRLPFNIGLTKIKTPLSEMTDEDLERALKFARDVGKYVELVEAISLVLDDRRYDARQAAANEEATS